MTASRSARAVCEALLCTLLACNAGTPSASAPMVSQRAPSSVSAFELSTLNLDRERAFFAALGFDAEPASTISGIAFGDLTSLRRSRALQQRLKLGEQRLVLTQFLEPLGNQVEVQHANDLGFQHVAIVVRDMDRAYEQLQRTNAVRISPEPQTIPERNPVSAGVRALYFRDPEGHFLELLSFPPGKDEAKWRRAAGSVFLGIDHSAIACQDTERSLRFYRDALGLRVASESMNEGVEQRRLSGVGDARVKITSLRGGQGPGIELLEYLSPRGGLPFPHASAADTVHWQIALEVASVDEALVELHRAGFASSNMRGVDVSQLPAQGERAVLVEDPDGHTLRLFERPSRGANTQ